MKITSAQNLKEYLLNFPGSTAGQGDLFDRPAQVTSLVRDIGFIDQYINEFWTARQRQAANIHEISYRACFKPQLPRFFIELFSAPGDMVYDPFSGRGTTAIEAALLGRQVIANDINPLSQILTAPRLRPPDLGEVAARLNDIPWSDKAKADLDLSMFFHPTTEAEIVSIKGYLAERKADRLEDDLDRWIRLVATNRLTGHSPGFFSVYSLPPNQAASPQSQIKINERLGQKPPRREVKGIILKKTRSLLKDLGPSQIHNLKTACRTACFLAKDAAETSEIPADSVQLIVTSPPFLDVVQYPQDNWMRCWFNSLDAQEIGRRITSARTIAQWSAYMAQAFQEFYRLIKPGGWVAFEVGEVKNRTVRLDEHVVPLGQTAGFTCHGILINSQKFTKTANIWGIDNNQRGTNTNRIVLCRKD